MEALITEELFYMSLLQEELNKYMIQEEVDSEFTMIVETLQSAGYQFNNREDLTYKQILESLNSIILEDEDLTEEQRRIIEGFFDTLGKYAQ